MHWRQYEYFYNLMCKMKKETNKILNYLFEHYWNDDEESIIFIKEIFKQMFLQKLDLNYENKIQNLLNNQMDIYKEEVIPYLENLMEFEIEVMLASNKKNGIENKRNGYRTRIINSIFGKYELKIPRDRLGGYFPSFLQKRVSALACLLKRVIADLKVTQNQSLVRKCLAQVGINLSKPFISSVYDMMFEKAKSLYSERVFPSKIDAIMLDATYVYVKKDGEKWQIIDDYTGESIEYTQSKKVCVLQAYGINFKDNSKIDLGFMIVNRENIINYMTFLEEIKSKGVQEITLLMADKHPAIRTAMAIVFPNCNQYQHCFLHAKRTVQNMVPNKNNKQIINLMFRFMTNQVTHDQIIEAIPNYISQLSVSETIKKRVFEWIMQHLDEILTFRKYPYKLWKTIYTTNYIESKNKQIKLQIKMKGCAYSIETLHKQILISKAILLKLI